MRLAVDGRKLTDFGIGTYLRALLRGLDGRSDLELTVIARSGHEDRVEELAPGKKFVLQAGAFSDLDRADNLKAALRQLTGKPTYVVKVSGESLYRVRLGPVRGRTEAERLKSVIHAADYGTALILPH